jgi:hypothetical protein
MKIPQDWKVVEGRDFVDNKKNWNQIGLGTTGKKVADIGGLMSINLMVSDQSLVDKVDAEKKKYKAIGYESLREGEQLNTGGIDISLLFWKKELPGGGAGVIYEALFKKEQRIFVLTSEVPLVDSPKYEKTFYAIYESIVLF